MKRIVIFDSPMDVATIDETVDRISERMDRDQFTQHVVVNAAKIVNMQRDRRLSESIKSCDIINIDGMSVVWAARLLGYNVPERVAGIDLFHKLLEHAAQRHIPIFLLGAEIGVIERTVQVVTEKYPGLDIVGFHHGYFWQNEEQIVELIAKSGAKMLFVAISSPLKENFINKWRHKLGVKFVMGVGGTFDVVAGRVSRAPQWMQRMGLEWAYRVLQEPRRMWKRYLVTNIRFVLMLLYAWRRGPVNVER